MRHERNMCLDMILLPMSHEICLMQRLRLCCFRKWCLLYHFYGHTSVPTAILLNMYLSISTVSNTVYILYMYIYAYIYVLYIWGIYIWDSHTHTNAHTYPMLWTGQAATLIRKLAFKDLVIRCKERESQIFAPNVFFFLYYCSKLKEN